ncbi:MAG: LPS export ABC transporter permease LptG [Alphaproteobacteria bacterium]|nr:LPS export ABC transporter permease LptG [Alphaproteobacteria bacterium]
MRLPLTLSLYIGRHFFAAIGYTLLVIFVLIGLIQLIELVREASETQGGIPFATVVEMALLRLPSTAQKIYPFAILIGGMITLSRLTRSHELIVARAAGVSAWQFLLPGVASAMLIGMFIVLVLSPLSASMLKRYDTLEKRHITKRESILTISPSGLWLRQVERTPTQFNGQPIGEYILHARSIEQNSLNLQGVIFFMFDPNKRFIGRIDGNSGRLSDGTWTVDTARIATPGLPIVTEPSYTLNTALSIEQIQDSFADPETLSFWQLPGFINVLETSGFPALRHKLYFYSQLALPMLLAGMVLIGALFSLRLPRRGRTGMMIVFGIVTGFTFYFLSNLVYAFGASGSLPPWLAAWAPSLVAMMAGAALLLHYEDG